MRRASSTVVRQRGRECRGVRRGLEADAFGLLVSFVCERGSTRRPRRKFSDPGGRRKEFVCFEWEDESRQASLERIMSLQSYRESSTPARYTS